jgi:hypothetical protein
MVASRDAPDRYAGEATSLQAAHTWSVDNMSGAVVAPNENMSRKSKRGHYQQELETNLAQDLAVPPLVV